MLVSNVPIPWEPERMTMRASESSQRTEESAPLVARRFRDRREAGRELAGILGRRGYERPVVLGIPTGGVVLAAEVAESLNAELALAVTRKLQAPYQPGLTLGAVTADNVPWVHGGVAEEVGADEGYLAAEIQRRAKEARRLERDLGAGGCPMVHGRTALVVDDGIVTAARALAALHSASRAGAGRVVFAAAVGSPEAFERVRGESFEAVALVEDQHFVSVADFFEDFRPVTSSAVRALMTAAQRRMAC